MRSIEENEEKKLRSMEKELIKYNELNKNDFTINKDGVFKKKQEEILSELTKEKSYEVNALMRNIYYDNLIYELKDKNIPKDFSNYLNPK